MRLTYNPEFERSCITFIAKMKGTYIEKMLELQQIIKKLNKLNETFDDYRESEPEKDFRLDNEETLKFLKGIASELGFQISHTPNCLYTFEKKFGEYWMLVHCLYILKTSAEIIGVDIPENLCSVNCKHLCGGYHAE